MGSFFDTPNRCRNIRLRNPIREKNEILHVDETKTKVHLQKIIKSTKAKFSSPRFVRGWNPGPKNPGVYKKGVQICK